MRSACIGHQVQDYAQDKIELFSPGLLSYARGSEVALTVVLLPKVGFRIDLNFLPSEFCRIACREICVTL